MVGPESYVEDENPDLPEEANFLYNAEEEFYSEWYDSPNELEHGYGVDLDSSRITIEERDSEEWDSKHLADIVDGIDTPVYIKDNDIEKVEGELDLDLNVIFEQAIKNLQNDGVVIPDGAGERAVAFITDRYAAYY